MKLGHLSIASIVACLLGLFALLIVSVYSLQQMQAKQAEVASLLALQGRIDDISVASDQFLIYPPDITLWRAFRAETLDARGELAELAGAHPGAQRAAQLIDQLLEMLASVREEAAQAAASDADPGGVAPMEMPLRSRVLMTEMAGHGIALDTALDDVLRARQQAIAREASRITAGFAAAAMLFGMLCIIAFTLVHRRIVGPARALARTLEQQAEGDSGTRAPVRGNDEFADLAHAFNHMLDGRNRAESRLHEYRELIEGSHDLYAIIDADYRYVLINHTYAATYGFDPQSVEGRSVQELFGEDFFRSHVKPKLDRALAGDTVEFEAERDYAGRGRRQVLIRYYPIAGVDGRAHRVGASVTDITVLKRVEAELLAKARLLDMAGRVGRFGGWTVDLDPERVQWSDVVAEIHGLPPGCSPSLQDSVEFFAPEHRERALALFDACVEHGTPFDAELQIVTAGGERCWVRSVGTPVRDEQGTIVRIEGAFQNIQARKASERQAERLGERLRATLESITDAFYTLDREWCFGYVNKAAERLLERSRDELIGRNAWEAFPEAAGSAIEQAYRRAAEEGITVTLEEYYVPLGKWFDIRVYPYEDGVAVYFRDDSERRQLLDTLREHERELESSHLQLEQALETRQALINSLPAHIALLDREGTIIDVNDQWRHFGRDNDYAHPGSGLGLNYLSICRAASGECAEEAGAALEGLQAVLAGRREHFVLEYPCHSPDRYRWFRMMANRLVPGVTGEKFGAVVMHVDVTERKLAEQELQRVATVDLVSGALSRHGFVHGVSQHLEAAGWSSDGMVVILDVEGQRDINDAHGYEVGDHLLSQIAARLGQQAGEHGIVGRVGGDEFAVFLPPKEHGSPEQQRSALAAVFKQSFRLKQVQVKADARFGYTLMGEQPRSAEKLLREAELALFEARRYSAGEWAAYTRDLDSAARERLELTRELRVALEEGQFELHFQPKVDLASGRLIACEALLRWQHPQRGLQSPGMFIPIAEQSQLMGPIGDWVLLEACRHLRGWRDAGLDVVRVSVNVSVVQLRQGRFVERVREAIAAHVIAPDALTLEITESMFERESEFLREQLQQLHELGVRLSLDDFGTGYSSLLYLQRYPFDEIKIDMGFVKRILEDAYSRKIVATVLGIAGALGAEAVAEGIESRGVCDALLGMGCRIGQGYYYSVPLAAEDFRWLLDKRSTLPLDSASHGSRRG